jgi:hypothetical protein
VSCYLVAAAEVEDAKICVTRSRIGKNATFTGGVCSSSPKILKKERFVEVHGTRTHNLGFCREIQIELRSWLR